MNLFDIERMKYWSIPNTFKGDKKEKLNKLLISGDYLGSLKKDGDWSAFIKQGGRFEQQTRGRNVKGGFNDKSEHVPHISYILDQLFKEGTMIVGELYYPGLTSTGVGSILRCLPEKAKKRQENNLLRFYIFDVWAYNGKLLFDTAFEKRVEILQEIQGNIIYSRDKTIEFASYVKGKPLLELLVKGLEKEEEGIVAILRNSPVYFKRTPAWESIKVKKELANDLDVFLTGNYKSATKEYKGDHLEDWGYWENERTGELLDGKHFQSYIDGAPLLPISKAYFLGLPGSLEIGVFKDNIITPIGSISGITEKIRKDFITDIDKFRLKICKVQAMEIHETLGIRHAKFMNFRDDIDVKDCTWEKIYG